MTIVATPVPISPTSVRIAITSPDILAQIRQVFASKNLALEFVRMPYVEVIVRPAAGAAAGAAGPDRSAVGTALERVGGPASRAGVHASRRLCAEYRLSVVEVGGRPTAEHPAPEIPPHPVPVPAPDADRLLVALSQRQHEVMALVSRGARNSEIAARLQVSEKTVKNHINRIFRSLGAGSRVEAVLIWQRHQQDGAIRRGAPNPPLAPAPSLHPGHGGNP
ncbi:helix-turn-helix transcriptional regulator [Streptomyces sp. SID13666]|uniref:helix-turn-helix transcriptional regulator n=1 Tax=unclassified Streptomyces TaxID=2593676 RepID=UPI0013C172E1|nr:MULTISPECIES: helix-turn-helix transcriptional regulator [unclassified Streptomyces]NEA53145.1 helix-turn-helix transcriptional regulator [Streptomyces sp. SID13666]NEA69528.1 helix-turn-helix transcriptional regulator [Streptomyces sp. SID13588]